MVRAVLIASAFVTAIAVAPAFGADGFDARFAAAVAQAQRGDHDAALSAFEMLAREFPTRPEPLNNLAAELARRGDLVRAREVLERALRTQPAYATAHDNLRTVYAALASDAYRKALPVGAEPAAPPELALIARTTPTPITVAVPVTRPSVTHAAIAAAPAAPQGGAETATSISNGRAFAAFAAVDAWAQAWAQQDVAGYLAAYGRGFTAPDGLTRAAWEAQRTERIRAPKQISISLAQRDLTLDASGERASLRFVQTYRSDRFNGSAWKTLELERQGGRWQIVAERAGR